MMLALMRSEARCSAECSRGAGFACGRPTEAEPTLFRSAWMSGCLDSLKKGTTAGAKGTAKWGNFFCCACRLGVLELALARCL